MAKSKVDRVPITARHKIDHIQKQLARHPLKANDKQMLDRLEYWKKKI